MRGLGLGLGLVFVFRYAALATGSKKWAWLGVLLLLLLGGADFYAELWHRYIDELPIQAVMGLRYEIWIYDSTRLPLEYSSFITALTWVPHQSIAAFLVAGMLLNLRDGSQLPPALLAFGLLAFWSPFGMIGLLPFVVMQVVRYLPALRTTHGYACIAAGGCFALIVIAFLMVDLPPSMICFSCIPSRIANYHRLVLFIVVEILPFALILRKRMLYDWSCLIACIMLALIPLAYGETVDFVSRVSQGALFVLALRSIQTIFETPVRPSARAAQALALLLCVPATVSEAVYHMQDGSAHAT